MHDDSPAKTGKADESMGLPTGATCADCRHFRRCAWLISRAGPETECDWYPIRFKPKGDA